MDAVKGPVPGPGKEVDENSDHFWSFLSIMGRAPKVLQSAVRYYLYGLPPGRPLPHRP